MLSCHARTSVRRSWGSHNTPFENRFGADADAIFPAAIDSSLLFGRRNLEPAIEGSRPKRRLDYRFPRRELARSGNGAGGAGRSGGKVGERKRSRAAGNALALRQARNERAALHRRAPSRVLVVTHVRASAPVCAALFPLLLSPFSLSSPSFFLRRSLDWLTGRATERTRPKQCLIRAVVHCHRAYPVSQKHLPPTRKPIPLVYSRAFPRLFADRRLILDDRRRAYGGNFPE